MQNIPPPLFSSFHLSIKTTQTETKTEPKPAAVIMRLGTHWIKSLGLDGAIYLFICLFVCSL